MAVFSAMQPWLEEQEENWPVGYRWEFGGEFEASVKANQSIADKMPIAGLLIIGTLNAPYTIVLGSFMQLPIVLFRLVAGMDENLGQFALAYQSIGYLIAIPIVMATTTLPVLSRSATRGDGKDLR